MKDCDTFDDKNMKSKVKRSPVTLKDVDDTKKQDKSVTFGGFGWNTTEAKRKCMHFCNGISSHYCGLV